MKNFYVFLTLLIIFYSSAFAQRSLHPDFPVTRVDFFLTLTDGTVLDCTKFIPTGTPPAGGWPCVVVTHGFGLDKYSELDDAQSLAQDGFYSMVYSMRGQGISTGQSNLISTLEMNDLIQVVQYVRADANTNDNRIAIYGGSQGGILPFMATCNGLNVRTIISDLASPEFATSWIENGCVKMSLLWSLSYTSNIVRYNSQVGQYKNWIYSKSQDKWDSLAHYIPIGRDFLDQVSNCNVPILIENPWQDKFFNVLGQIKAAYILPYSNYRMYFGAMDGHGSDYNQGELDYQSQLLSDWYDYWLYNIQNNVMNDNNKFVYGSSQYPTGNRNFWTWSHVSSQTWPPAGIQPVSLYLWPGNQLLPVPYTGSTASVSFVNDVIDTSVTMEYLVNTEFHGPLFDAKFAKHQLVFDTPALLQDCKMAGNITAELFYSSTANVFCQYNFQVWDVAANGNAKLVTRANFTDRDYSANDLNENNFNGVSYSHIFKQGDKIRVVATNLDNQPLYANGTGGDTADTFLRTNPFVLPVLNRGTNSIYINGSHQSYIQLPLSNFVIGIRNISTEVPASYKLEQNYPNPFNPSTKIKFQIPNRNSITLLKIYDILGREVTTLVNEINLPAGTYEADWNASNYSSGIYFYRLITGNYVETKKMILVK